MKKLSIVLVLFLIPLKISLADICAGASISAPESTPTSRFEYEIDGLTVVDKQTGLMWARCQFGYDWSVLEKSCFYLDNSVESSLSWKSALKMVVNNNASDAPYLGYSDWRLPNIKELASIVERKCNSPAINSEVFSGGTPSPFWSNTHVEGAAQIRIINFKTGQVGGAGSNDKLHLRLVRDIPDSE